MEPKAKRYKMEAKGPGVLFVHDLFQAIINFLPIKDIRVLSTTSKYIHKEAMKHLYKKTKLMGHAANLFKTFRLETLALTTVADRLSRDMWWSMDRFAILIISSSRKRTRVIGKFVETAHITKSDYMILELPYMKNWKGEKYVNLREWELLLHKGHVIGIDNISVILQKAIARGDDIFYLYFPMWLQKRDENKLEWNNTLMEMIPAKSPAPNYAFEGFRIVTKYHHIHHYFYMYLTDPPVASTRGPLTRKSLMAAERHRDKEYSQLWKELVEHKRKKSDFSTPQPGFPSLMLSQPRAFYCNPEAIILKHDPIPLHAYFHGFYATTSIINAE